jgi:trimethylamine:corrinoid methyltransferase-like protein
MKRSRRAGGRTARQALRAAPLAEHIRPVRAGLSGGAYNPLSDAGVQRIHQAALDALEQIGFADAPPSGARSRAMTDASASPGRWSRTCWRWRRAISRCAPAIRSTTCN